MCSEYTVHYEAFGGYSKVNDMRGRIDLSLFLSLSLSPSLPPSLPLPLSLHTHFHGAGIPTPPVITSIESKAFDEVTISLRVPEAGLSPTNPTLYFDILATNDTSEFRFEAKLQDYLDNTTTQFTVSVPGLVPGQEYTFSVRVRNEFGSSDFVQFGTPVNISGKCS